MPKRKLIKLILVAILCSVFGNIPTLEVFGQDVRSQLLDAETDSSRQTPEALVQNEKYYHSLPPESADAQKTISVEAAQRLVNVYLKSGLCKKGACTLERISDPYFPDLYCFEGTWDNPDGSPILGHWAVDPATGDLWDADVCVRYENQPVRKLQRELRKLIHLSDKDYARIKRRPPMCDSDEKPQVRR